MCSLHAYKLLKYFEAPCCVFKCVYMSVYTLENACRLKFTVCVYLLICALALPAPLTVHVSNSSVWLTEPTRNSMEIKNTLN